MSRMPFIGRLHMHEYLALLASFLLLSLETVVRTITLLLPGPIIRFFYRISRHAFNSLSSPYSRRARNKKKSVSSSIAHASDFVELCELYGYYAEEHIVQTKDGYLLGLHRLGWRKGEEESARRVNAGPGSLRKKVVYLHHGLLMNSEVWVCITDPERCLPFTLVDQGYDVWLGNNRGNKYSKKCLHSTPTDPAFWNFSMDQFAFHDIPDSIDYILSTTHQPRLSYIGFSQGSAQAFAALSIHPTLNAKVAVFIALAPAMAPPGLASGVVSSLVKSNPDLLFLFFGRHAMLGSATMWQALLYPAIFTYFIDQSLLFLFGWRTHNIPPHQKLAAYPHLYSFTSTKSVVHWFQIIRNGTFQMYDDEVTSPLALGNGSKYYKVAKFPTRNIKTPIVLIYGGSDSLVDIKLMLKELPKHTRAKGIPKYEHLDFLWAGDVDRLVFPHVLEALQAYEGADELQTTAMTATKAEQAPLLGWRNTTMVNGEVDQAGSLPPSSNSSLPPSYSGDERGQAGVLPHQAFDFGIDERPSTAEEQLDETDDEDEDDDEPPERLALTRHRFAPQSPAPTPAGVSLTATESRTKPSVRSSTTSSTVGASSSQHTLTEPNPHRRRLLLSPRRLPRGPRAQTQAQRHDDEASEPQLQSVEGENDEVPDSPTVVPTELSSRTARPEGWWSSSSTATTTTSTAESSPSASRDPLHQQRNGVENATTSSSSSKRAADDVDDVRDEARVEQERETRDSVVTNPTANAPEDVRRGPLGKGESGASHDGGIDDQGVLSANGASKAEMDAAANGISGKNKKRARME